LRFEYKEECYKLISFLFFLGILSSVLLFFFHIYDFILFIFLILISNFVIIQAKIREILKFLLPKGDLRFYIAGAGAGALTTFEKSESGSSENCDTTTTVSGSDSGNAFVIPSTEPEAEPEDLRIYSYDHKTESITLLQTGEKIMLPYPDNNKGETASSTDLPGSKDAIIKPLETIEEKDEENYEGEMEGYNSSASDEGEMEGYNSNGSDGWLHKEYFPNLSSIPASSSRATPCESSSDIEIEGPYYNSDEEEGANSPSYYDDYDDEGLSNILLPLARFAFNSKILTMLARVARVILLVRYVWVVYSFF
jgi:hypothetical protein